MPAKPRAIPGTVFSTIYPIAGGASADARTGAMLRAVMLFSPKRFPIRVFPRQTSPQHRFVAKSP
jgi:hypothetical protein